MMSIGAVGRGAFVLALLAGALATPAHGQFGALRRAAAGAAARAAGNGAAPASGPAAAGQPPRFDNETLEITPQVATRFTAAMQAERQERQRIAAQRAGLGEYEVQVERFERCQRRESERRDAENAAVDEGQQVQLAARMTQAVMRGDTGTYRRLMDSVTNAQAAKATASSAACGARPNAAYAAIAAVRDADQRVQDAAAEAGGFTVRQLAILRERIAPYVLSEGRLAGAERAYTPAELEALRGAQPGLWGFATELRS